MSEDIVHWDSGPRGDAYTQGMDYKDGYLEVKEKGYYYVYSKVHFQECSLFKHKVKKLPRGYDDSQDLMTWSVCLPVCVYVCLCMSVCPSTCLSTCLYVCLSTCLSFCMFVYLSVCLSVCMSVCLSVYLSVFLYIRLPVCS